MKNTLINNYKFLLVLLTTFCFYNLNAQNGNGYSVDSLQIKVYTEIDYINNIPKAINIKKVFCDYCSESQVVGIEDEALRRSYIERNLKKNKLVNGIKRLALYIRISKSDFAYLEHNREMSIASYLVKNMGNTTKDKEEKEEEKTETTNIKDKDNNNNINTASVPSTNYD